MRLNLKRSLVFFDIEATGLNVIKDRIIQIALIKYKPGVEVPEELSMLINPGPVLISEEAFAVHGISSQMLANKPVFQQVAQSIFDFIGDADLAGYNSDRFDIPMLLEEFHRAGIEFDLIDPARAPIVKSPLNEFIPGRWEARSLSVSSGYAAAMVIDGRIGNVVVKRLVPSEVDFQG